MPLKSGFKWHLKLSNVLAIRPWSTCHCLWLQPIWLPTVSWSPTKVVVSFQRYKTLKHFCVRVLRSHDIVAHS